MQASVNCNKSIEEIEEKAIKRDYPIILSILKNGCIPIEQFTSKQLKNHWLKNDVIERSGATYKAVKMNDIKIAKDLLEQLCSGTIKKAGLNVDNHINE